jgi:GntR family transcriptional regulator
MLTPLSDTSPLPLREQLVQQVRELILSGTLAEHHRLPSIRALAREQGVGVVTVQRAFEDLEREGMVYARQGKGYFVAPMDEERRRALARDQTRDRLERPVREARAMGLADEEILGLVRELLPEAGKEPS